MNLKEFITYKHMTIAELTKYLEMPRTSIYRLLRGENVSLSTAFEVQKKTRGKVKVNDIYMTYLENVSKKKLKGKSSKN